MDHIVEYGRLGVLLADGLRVNKRFVGGGGIPPETSDRNIVYIKDDETREIARIVYPSFSELAGNPQPADDVSGFYLQGDYMFHHLEDIDVRIYAIEASRSLTASGYPGDVSSAADNIYNYINHHLGDDSKGFIRRDEKIVQMLPNVTEKHACISQAYLFGSFARTIGIPAREIDVALGKSIAKIGPRVFAVLYDQEAAIQVWYGNDWHLYDTFLGITNWNDYFKVTWGEEDEPCIKYRPWHSYDRRYDVSPTLPGLGHNFWIESFLGEPFPADSKGWKPLEGDADESLIFVINSPVNTYVSDAVDNKTGYFEGSILEEIPSSYYLQAGTQMSTNRADPTAYWEADETIVISQNGQFEDYSLVLTGTDDGHYDLTMAYMHDDGTINGSTIRFEIRKDETHTFAISLNSAGEISITGVPVRLDIDPDTINLSSQGNWVTCYIELPEGFDVDLIDGSTVELNGIPAEMKRQSWATPEANDTNIVDHDGDGVFERMVKFDLFFVQVLLTPGDADVTVSGELTDGTYFQGSDVIRVIE